LRKRDVRNANTSTQESPVESMTHLFYVAFNGAVVVLWRRHETDCGSSEH
jgi:hypothetical protein